jgi:hypothetical protein
MEPTTAGRFRVFEGRTADELLLVDVETDDPTYVPTTGYESEIAEIVASLDPGNLVDATLSWPDGDPVFAEVGVATRTAFSFVDGTDEMFEAAESTFQAARASGEPMASRVTHDTDGDPNGVIYTIAKQSGERDIFDEIRSGMLTLEPFVQRLRDGGANPPFEVFVIRPTTEPFVVVYLVMETGGLLAETIRDTYRDDADW